MEEKQFNNIWSWVPGELQFSTTQATVKKKKIHIMVSVYIFIKRLLAQDGVGGDQWICQNTFVSHFFQPTAVKIAMMYLQFYEQSPCVSSHCMCKVKLLHLPLSCCNI